MRGSSAEVCQLNVVQCCNLFPTLRIRLTKASIMDKNPMPTLPKRGEEVKGDVELNKQEPAVL